MANLNAPMAGKSGSSTSTPSYQSEYVDAPSTPSSTKNQSNRRNNHRLNNIDYFELSPATESTNRLELDPSAHTLSHIPAVPHFPPTPLPPPSTSQTHSSPYSSTIAIDFETSNSTPLLFDSITDSSTITPSRHRRETCESAFSNQYSSSTVRNYEQVGLRTNPIDRENFLSPSSDDGDGGASTKLVLKNIVPSLRSSDSETSSLSQSPRDMSFAPLPGSGHVNIDEIPLNSPLDDSGQEQESHGFHPSRGFLYAFGSICIITLAAALDATSLAIALPIITGKLKGTAIEAFWSGTSFLITSAVFQPIIAGLSHIFGRKELILISALFFAVGSTFGALANNFTIMLIGRSIQGIGGGGILTLGEIMLTDLVPLAYRGAWFGYLGSIWAIGSVTGPLMGASFAQKVTWRWIFWINLPIIIIGSIAITLFLKLDKIQGKLSDKLARFDWLGSVVFCGACVSFLIPLTWGGVMYPWNHWRTLVPLFVGLIGIGGFIYYEWVLTGKCWDRNGNPLPGNNIEPIIRFTIFNNATMVLTYLQTILHGIVLWSLLYFLPLYYEGVLLYSPVITGVAALPETGFVAPMAIFVGVISAKTGHYRWAVWSGWALTTIGAGLLVLMKPDTTVPQWILLNITISVGAGMLFTAMGLAVQAAGIPEDAGHAAGFYSFVRVIGQSLGVAIGGVVFQNQIYSNLLNYPLLKDQAMEYSKDATVLAVIIKLMPPGIRRTQLIQAYCDALSMIWVVMCAVAGLGFLLSIFVKGYTLEQEHKTLQGYKYDGVEGDEERSGSSYANRKYSSGDGHVYDGAMGSVSNLEMSNLSGGYGLNNTSHANISTVSLDQVSDGMNRRRGTNASSTMSLNGGEVKQLHLGT